MSYNNTKLLAAILGYSLLACSICGCSADTQTLTTESTEASSSSELSEYAVTHLDTDDMFTDRDKEVGYDEESAVSVTLADGATSCSDDSVNIEDDTVTISEEGTYILSGNLNDGQVITSGTYTITAAMHALSGKDSVRIADGVITLDAGTDGIHSENTDKDGKGFIYIAGGDINIEADSDGMDAEETLQIDGGSMTIAAGDDGVHSDADLIITDGTIDVTKSYEGLEGMTVTIEDGDISVVSSDDGLNAAGDPADAATSDNASDTDTKNPTSSANDTQNGSVADAQTVSTTSDNNSNSASSGSTDSADTNNSDKSTITPPQRPDGSNDNGGTPPAKPDGSDTTGSTPPQCPDDSNMPSGGPGGGGGMDETHDYNFIVISGGTMIAVGASGMAQNFGSDSTQGSMLVTVADSTLTGDLTLTDSDGNVIVSYSPEKAYNSVVISCPDLKEGETYTLTTGDITTTVNMSSLIYGEDDQMQR